MRSVKRITSYLILYAIAMGFMESAVVIYLREIYYPGGFQFPLVPIPPRLAFVEIGREAATVIMLICAGYLAGKTSLQRFAFFSVAFAVWDLFYYIFLYVFLGWPQSLFTWDILFLIPLPWVGPVWAPCLLCVLMIGGSLPVILKTESGQLFKIKKWEWVALLSGACICIFSFMYDYLQQAGSLLKNPVVTRSSLFSDFHTYVPDTFNHLVFFAGFFLMLGAICHNLIITNKNQKHEK